MNHGPGRDGTPGWGTLRFGVLCLMLVLVLGVVALGSIPVFANDEVAVIRELRSQSNAAIARHDAQAVGSFLAEDYVITISTGQIERSREENIGSFSEHFTQYPDVLYVRTPERVQISDAYPLAIEQGTWVGTRGSGKSHQQKGGPYTAAWRKTEEGWKIYSELFVALYCHGADC